MTKRAKLSTLASVFATLVATSSVQASPIFFNDLTDFNNASGATALTVVDFESVMNNTDSGTDFGPYMIETNDDIDIRHYGTNGPKAIKVSESAEDYIKFTFETPITAFRIDLVDALDTGGGSIFVTVDGGSPEEVIGPVGDQDNLNQMFIGVIDLDGFTMMKIDANDKVDFIYYDNMHYGSAMLVALGNVAEVAEPGAFAIFSLGLAGLGLMRRRRVARQV